MKRTPMGVTAILVAVGAAVSGCAGGSKSPAGSGSTAAPLAAEAASATAGDIPDNQRFLTFRDRAAGWSMSYPEGWAQSARGARVTFRDKNNVVRVAIEPGRVPSVGTASADLRAGGASAVTGSGSVRLPAGPALKLTYTTRSPPNPVTGKRVTLAVDRYYLTRGPKRAVVELGAPQGVDNVDAYRMMIRSFRWR